MSKRFYYDEFCEEIFDEEIQTYPSNQSICGILNKQEDRISELEEQLKNAIVPKFKIGQEIWCIRFMKIIKFKINKIEIYRGESEEENRILYGNWEDMTYQIEENCFLTKEEAEAKLKDLGEKK